MWPCRHLDISDPNNFAYPNVDWLKCRKAFEDGELQCPPDAISEIE